MGDKLVPNPVYGDVQVETSITESCRTLRQLSNPIYGDRDSERSSGIYSLPSPTEIPEGERMIEESSQFHSVPDKSSHSSLKEGKLNQGIAMHSTSDKTAQNLEVERNLDESLGIYSVPRKSSPSMENKVSIEKKSDRPIYSYPMVTRMAGRRKLANGNICIIPSKTFTNIVVVYTSMHGCYRVRLQIGMYLTTIFMLCTCSIDE